MKKGKTFLINRPRLAITLGDPAGIGPEVILKALSDPEVTRNCQITVFGARSVLEDTYAQLLEDQWELEDIEFLSIADIPLEKSVKNQIVPGVGNAASGAASFTYLEKAIASTFAGSFDGIVTGPISKSSWKAAGHDYPGQTEMLAKYSGVKKFGMLFVAKSPHNGWVLRTLLATTHIPLSQVPTTLTPQLMSEKLELLVESLHDDFGIVTPRIAISGLNPHSGEQGQLGTEEAWLTSWMDEERNNYPETQLDGPVSPDTLWVKAGQAWNAEPSGENFRYYADIVPILKEEFGLEDIPEAFLALYHDQGLIPVKLLAFDRAVNTTIGLPFVRTSPDHGTAFDIAGQGVADETSMKEAILLAAELVKQKQAQS